VARRGEARHEGLLLRERDRLRYGPSASGPSPPAVRAALWAVRVMVPTGLQPGVADALRGGARGLELRGGLRVVAGEAAAREHPRAQQLRLDEGRRLRARRRPAPSSAR
jgi:hypothetical protein